MMGSRFIGRVLFWGITALMLAGATLLVLAFRNQLTRTEELTQQTLDQLIGKVSARVDVALQDHAQDLRQEAAFIRQYDSIPVKELLERWEPLMNTRWAITSVLLADEDGSELALVRRDSVWEVRSLDSTLAVAPHWTTRGPWNTAPGRLPYQWTLDTLNDPRQAIWFSRALEDRSGDPIWSSVQITNGPSTYYVSMLVRGSSYEDPYRILAFAIDASLALTGISGQEPRGLAETFLLNNDGDDLVQGSARDTAGAVRDSAVMQWRTARHRGMFKGTVGGKDYHALVVSNTIHGETYQVGAVVLDEQILQRTYPERRALLVRASFLLLMGLLLSWSYIRRRREAKLLRQQQKRTRSQERELAKALGERDVLDREVHHRVKNNLQVVSSLLNLQAQRIPEGPTKEEFVKGKRRIDAMALVHHKLYGMQDLRSIKLKDLFQQLADAVAELHQPGSRSVSHAVDTAGIISDPDTAIELGIILCELLDNCHQHAFPFATGGHIDIQVRAVSGDLYRLTVSDNGKGMDEAARNDTTKLGLEIVDALSGQLDGSFSMKSGNGVTFEVLFRMIHPVG